MKDTSKIPHWDKPMAAAGLTSYRYRRDRGYVMIGARDSSEALREVARSIDERVCISHLEVWNGSKYEPVSK